jgi:hypothetical protein
MNTALPTEAPTPQPVRTRYFLDTEFYERGPKYPIQYISLGIVCDDGRTFYAQNLTFDYSNVSDWLGRNVLPQLTHFNMGVRQRSCTPLGKYDSDGRCEASDCPWYKGSKLGPKIIDFVWNQFTPVLGREKIKPEFWAYYADYDWVVFCQLFGSMIDLPQGFPMYCRDIKQKADEVEEYLQREHDANFRLRLPKQMGEHNALADAQWNRKALANLETYADDPQLFMRKYGESKVFMELEAK